MIEIYAKAFHRMYGYILFRFKLAYISQDNLNFNNFSKRVDAKNLYIYLTNKFKKIVHLASRSLQTPG